MMHVEWGFLFLSVLIASVIGKPEIEALALGSECLAGKDTSSSACHLELLQTKAHALSDPSAELTSAPDGGHQGPVTGDPKGNATHFKGPKGQSANSDSKSYYGNPQGDGTKKADSLGDTHWDAPGT